MSFLKNNILLKNFSNFKIGGPASFFLEVKTTDDLKNGLREWISIPNNGKYFILGKGTNVLFPDQGFDGLVILNKIEGIEKDGDLIKVASGTLFSDLVQFAIDNSLTGLEWAGGLPGTVGGAARGNAGAFLGEAKDNIVKIQSINVNDLSERERWRKDLDYDYRDSVFKSGEAKDEFITFVWFGLSGGIKEDIQRSTQEKVEFRNTKHPVEFPNIGSMFKNVPKERVSQELMEQYQLPIKDDPFPIVPVAKLLSIAGLKGTTVGGAQVSEKHPNFIINTGSASSEDVVKLMDLERQDIKEKFGLDLEEEVIIL